MIRRKLPIVLLAMFLFASCGKYIVHPGSINVVDSKTYDSLIIAQAAIQQGHQQLVDGRLADSLKPALVSLEKSYNIALPAYKTWHAANVGNLNATLPVELVQAMNALTQTLIAFQKGGK